MVEKDKIRDETQRRDEEFSEIDEEDFEDDVNKINKETDIDFEEESNEKMVIEKEDGEIKDKELKKKQNKQIKWAVFLMVSLTLIILAVPYITKNYINKFDYIGLEFQKTKLGDLVFYSTKFPVVRGTGQVIGEYSVNFRSDPRNLEYIKIVDIPDNIITFMEGLRGSYTPVYISLDTEMKTCEDSGIALMNLAGFLRDSGLDVKSAVTNATYAEENGVEYATCLNKPGNTVIRIYSGNKTAIYKTMKNCYDIVFKDCEIIPATEKFSILILEEYAKRFIDV